MGLKINGHSGYAENGKDVVCAAVSSAVQLTMNLLDEFGFQPDVQIKKNDINFMVKNRNNDVSRIINTLMFHFNAILEEYPNTIKITTTEV